MDFIYCTGELVGKKYKPQMRFAYRLAIPAEWAAEGAPEAALLIEHDGLNEENAAALLSLAREGKAPFTVCVGVEPGILEMPDGSVRGMRMNSYDLFDSEYGDFIVYELVPHVVCAHSLRISPSAGMHAVSGGSSGGISAFVAAWFHPEFFRRVYMSSPSFLAMGRGNELPYLIRKYETKPLIVYQEMSENEPDDYFGCSYPIDLEAKKALEFSGYDFECKFFPGEGHCSRYHDLGEALIRFERLWRLWRSNEGAVRALSPRVARIISAGEPWERCEKFVKAERKKAYAPGYRSACVSSDGNMVYAAPERGDTVYALTEGGACLVHALLHTLPRRSPDVMDMTVSADDRLFVLTESGIQCVRSFGLIDAILDLPDAAAPQAISFGQSDPEYLYVKTEAGIWRRRTLVTGALAENTPRAAQSYYD